MLLTLDSLTQCYREGEREREDSEERMVAVLAAACATLAALVVSGIFLGLRFPGRARDIVLQFAGVLQGE